MDRCAHAGSHIGLAREVAILLRNLEILSRLILHRLLHSIDSPGKSLKDTLRIATLLHGDDPQLVLLIHPHEEGLLLVVVDAPALRPVSLHTSSDQILVPGDEKEVIIK